MVSHTTPARADEADGLLFDSWFDPIEDGLRAKVRGFIEAMIEEELTTALARPRYGRRCQRKLHAGLLPFMPALFSRSFRAPLCWRLRGREGARLPMVTASSIVWTRLNAAVMPILPPS